MALCNRKSRLASCLASVGFRTRLQHVPTYNGIRANGPSTSFGTPVKRIDYSAHVLHRDVLAVMKTARLSAKTTVRLGVPVRGISSAKLDHGFPRFLESAAAIRTPPNHFLETVSARGGPLRILRRISAATFVCEFPEHHDLPYES